MNNVIEIKFPHYTLVSIANPSSLELDDVGRRWELDALDREELAENAKRTRLNVNAHYGLLVTLWPTYRRSHKDIRSIELNFLIRPDALVVLQRGTLPVYGDLLQRYQSSSELRLRNQDRTPERLLYEILHHLYSTLFPMIDHLIEDCDTIEMEIFASHERQMISQILSIRRNITDVRHILQVHKNVLKRLLAYLTENPKFAMQSSDRYFISLLDTVKEEWDTLENLKERIEALQQTNESQISFRLSDIMKTLTIISVFTFPLTLVATIFSMGLTSGMPFLHTPGNFWYATGILAAVAGAMLLAFKGKRWF